MLVDGGGDEGGWGGDESSDRGRIDDKGTGGRVRMVGVEVMREGIER